MAAKKPPVVQSGRIERGNPSRLVATRVHVITRSKEAGKPKLPEEGVAGPRGFRSGCRPLDVRQHRRWSSVNLYFSCSLTGGRKDQVIYAQIVDHLLEHGHQVPTAHLARPEVMALEKVVNPAEVYRRDIDWIDGCQAMIAEVSTPSHGVGYEIAYALGRGKPVLCCYRQEVRVSKMITGNTHPLLRLRSYQSAAEAVQLVCEFLLDISKRRQTTLDTNVNKITWNQ